jgi:uncharacterized protein DUF397
MITEYSGQGSHAATWHKSSYSDSHGGNCVEVAGSPGAVRVRDSKDRSGPQLGFSAGQWAAFVADVRGSNGVA